MMTCNEVRELIPFLDDEPSDTRVHEAKRHLIRCETCRAEYDKMQSVVNLVRQTVSGERITAPSQYLDDVRTRIDRRKRRHVYAYRVIPAAAAVIFSVLIGLYSVYYAPGYNTIAEHQLFNAESQRIMDEYIAQQYLTPSEMVELAEEAEIAEGEESLTVETAMSTYMYDEITPEHIIYMMDESEYDLILASY